MSGALIALWIAAGVLFALGLRARRVGVPRGVGTPAPFRVAARLPAPAIVRRIAARPDTLARLRAAGLDAGVSAAAVGRARAGGAVAGMAVGLGLGVAAAPAALLGPVLAVGGYLLPDRWIARHRGRRREAILRDLPDLLDLLGVSVGAGMPLDAALAASATRLEGPLGEELGRTLRDLSLGSPRRKAYEDLAERAGTPELTRAVAALTQADELGAPLRDAVSAQATDMRSAEDAAARERAARAAPKIQLIVALMMVPAVMLVVMAVLISELARQIGVVMGA